MKNNKLEQAEIPVMKNSFYGSSENKNKIKQACKAKTKSFVSFVKQILAYFKFSIALLIDV